MQLDKFLEKKKKHIEENNSSYVIGTIFIISDHGLSGQGLVNWAEQIANKNKVLTYLLDNGSIALYKFSYPRRSYISSFNYKGKRRQIRSRSKHVLEWWGNYHYSITGIKPNIYLNDSSNGKVNYKIFNNILSKATVEYSCTTVRSFTAALCKSGYKGSYKLVSPVVGEYKKPKSKRQCVIDAANTVIRAQKLYSDDYKEITLGDIDHLAMLRYNANAKIKGEIENDD